MIDKVEDFVYNEEAEDNGQKLFFAFAAKHDAVFPDEFDPKEGENTLA